MKNRPVHYTDDYVYKYKCQADAYIVDEMNFVFTSFIVPSALIFC